MSKLVKFNFEIYVKGVRKNKDSIHHIDDADFKTLSKMFRLKQPLVTELTEKEAKEHRKEAEEKGPEDPEIVEDKKAAKSGKK